MTQEEIIELARQAGLTVGVANNGSKSMGKYEDKSFAVGRLPLEDFVTFAKLIHTRGWMQGYTSCDNDNKNLDSALIDDAVEEEREACAKLLETTDLGGLKDNPAIQSWFAEILLAYAKAIRVRGQA